MYSFCSEIILHSATRPNFGRGVFLWFVGLFLLKFIRPCVRGTQVSGNMNVAEMSCEQPRAGMFIIIFIYTFCLSGYDSLSCGRIVFFLRDRKLICNVDEIVIYAFN